MLKLELELVYASVSFYVGVSVCVWFLRVQQEIVLAEVEKLEPEKYVEKIVEVMDVKTSIQSGFKTGNAKLIASHFSQNVDISLLDKENLYSKSQAEQVLRTFFAENKPVSFTFVHEGQSNNMKYYIGTLTTENSKFRITVNVKSTSGVKYISHLTIELED